MTSRPAATVQISKEESVVVPVGAPIEAGRTKDLFKTETVDATRAEGSRQGPSGLGRKIPADGRRRQYGVTEVSAVFGAEPAGNL